MRYLVQPMVNINGTSREALINQQVEVMEALDKALDAMANAWPHPRDYQLQAPGTYQAAADAWSDRNRMLLALKDEINGYVTTLANAP